MRKKKVQYLTEKHKKKCQNFARKNVTRPQAEWDHVIFTDEKKWNLCGNDGYISAWIEGKNNKQYEQVTNCCGGLMVWGMISAFGGICLVCLEGEITAESYSKMLEEDFLTL